jgi:acyl-CoA synthetase (NDP forming)
MVCESIIQQIKSKGRTVLNEIESKQIIGLAGIAVVDAKLAKTKGEAISIGNDCGFPVVMKIMSPDLVHKSDAGGVRLNLNTADEVGEAYDEMFSSFI